MKRSPSTITLIGLLAIAAVQTAACAPTRTAHAARHPAVGGAIAVTSSNSALVTAAGPSCAQPTTDLIPSCDETARRILASTVRLELEAIPAGGNGSGNELLNGHGTVRDGRYVVTHNHYGLSLEEYGNGRLVNVSLYRADGIIVLQDMPPASVLVTAIGPETLLFDFGDYGGQGLLSVIGLASAEFGTPTSVGVQPGAEVAQVDWDGATAHVDWVPVTALQMDDATPYLETANFVRQGASGGGVFYSGVHIASNWSRISDHWTDSGEIVRQYSVAALNISQVAAMGSD